MGRGSLCEGGGSVEGEGRGPPCEGGGSGGGSGMHGLEWAGDPRVRGWAGDNYVRGVAVLEGGGEWHDSPEGLPIRLQLQ